MSDERKAALRKELNALFGMDADGNAVVGPASVYTGIDREVEDERRRIAQEALSVERQALEAEAELIVNRADRLAAENRILSILDEEEKAKLEQQIANGQITDALKARAELERAQSARRTGTAQQYESPMERRRREVRDTAANMGEAIENIELDAIDRLTDGLADAGTEFIKLSGIAGDVVNSIIRDLIRLAAQQAIFGGGGGGGFLGSLISGASVLFGGNNGTIGGGGDIVLGAKALSGAFGRASGGYVSPGQLVRVNEGASPGRVEGFQPAGSGHIIPLGRMNVASKGGGTTVIQQFTLDARYGITTPELLNAVNSRIKSEAGKAAGSAYAASQQSVPGTLNKYNQLNG